MEPFIGQIMLISYNFPPKGWAFCDGTLLPINQNQALFSLIGTTYGGDGIFNFALPDLRGRFAVGAGQGNNVPEVVQGEQTGGEWSTPATNPNDYGVTPYGLGLNYVIALQGIFPPQS